MNEARAGVDELSRAAHLGAAELSVAVGALDKNTLLRTFWIGFILTIAIWLFDDDAFEKWCQRCSYRRAPLKINTRKKIKFQILIPRYDERVASYHWAVHIHRFGNGHAQNYYRGELVCSGEFQPFHEIQISPSRGAFEPSPPKTPEDYDRQSILLNQSENRITGQNQQSYTCKEITGSIQLLLDKGRSDIEAATLTVTYWPDRNIRNAYAEIITKETSI